MKRGLLILFGILVLMFILIVGFNFKNAGEVVKSIDFGGRGLKEIEDSSSCIPSPEICDGLDNNCNGEIDEEEVCGGPQELSYDFDGYTIQLADDSVIEYKLVQEEKEIYDKSAIDFYRNNLLQKQNNLENKIKNLFPGSEVTSKYQNVLNGFSVKGVLEQDIERIKSLEGVKKVFKNYELSFMMNDANPVIGATRVWNLEDLYGRGITGQGISIAVIDSGIDYNHPAFGSCLFPAFEGENCFWTEEPLVIDYGNGETCTDWDGGINFCDYSAVSFYDGEGVEVGVDTKVDICLDSTTIREYSCSQDANNPFYFEEFVCPEGTICEENKCIKNHFDVQDCDKFLGGWDFYYDEPLPMNLASNGHGTHCAGIAAGNGDYDGDGIVEEGEGINGVAPDAQLYAYKVAGGYESISSDAMIEALERSSDPNQDGDFSDRIDVVSISLGGPGDPDDAKSQAVDNLVDLGTVVVIAVGNGGPDEQTVGSPGCARKGIGVGATYDKDYQDIWMSSECVPGSEDLGEVASCVCGNNLICEENFGETGYWCHYWGDINPLVDQIVSFSSRGPFIWEDSEGNMQSINKPDIVAPGALICAPKFDYQIAYFDYWPLGHTYSLCKDPHYLQLGGTSMATPVVAGAVALIKQAHPNWSPAKIKQALMETAVDIGEDINTQGAGRIDVLKAINWYCSDGSIYGECSSNYKYCLDGELIDACDKCGCPQGQVCRKVGGQPTCVGGVPVDESIR